MSKASTNRTALYSVKEVTWGTTPGTPAWKERRMTGESIDSSLSFEKSKEIRADRMVADTILVDKSPAGSFNIEFSGLSYDDFLEGLMMSAWSAELSIVGVAADISTTTDPTSNLTSTTGGKFTNVVEGQWIKLSGFSASNNIWYRVVDKVSATALTLSPVPAIAETPALALANIDGCYIRNGLTEQSWSLLKLFNDATTATRQLLTGMRITGASLDMSTGSILTGTFNVTGKDSTWTEATIGGETFVAASTTEVMNAVTNVEDVFQNGAAIGDGTIMQLGLEIDNQHREQKAIGVLGNAGVVASQLMVNGKMQQYFESKAQADLFEAATSFRFSFRLTSNDGYTYIFTLPKCKYESFSAPAGALDADVMADTSFTALRDPDTNCMIQIDKFAP